MEILRLGGTEKRLYNIVAPLVMNPAIIRQNNGYPFKTSSSYVWYVAMQDGTVEGFVPLKLKTGGALIDNYYIRADNTATIELLLQDIVAERAAQGRLEATVLKRHVETFAQCGFATTKEWRNYCKMLYQNGAEV